VNLSLEDNGIGFNTKAISSGRGMHSLQSRAARLGGELQIHSSVDTSFIFTDK
jgi:signal transduction histidine kinase